MSEPNREREDARTPSDDATGVIPRVREMGCRLPVVQDVYCSDCWPAETTSCPGCLPFEIPDEDPQEAMMCSLHDEVEAAHRCMNCRRNVCARCWDVEFGCCFECNEAPRFISIAPLPFELGQGSLVRRYFETLRSALVPVATARAFLATTDRAALFFFLLSFLPLALLRGIIPYTETLVFGPSFEIRWLEGGTLVAHDLMRASCLGLAEVTLTVCAFTLCALSLARTLETEREEAMAIVLRFALYRAFLVPLGALRPVSGPDGPAIVSDGLFMSLAGMGASANSFWPLVLGFALVAVPPALLLVALRSLGRVALGLRGAKSFAFWFLPTAFAVLTHGFVHELVAALVTLPVL